MGDLFVPAAILAAIALILVAIPGVVLMRRSVLSRGMGSFDCSLRHRPHGGGWSFGVARYEHDRLDWFRLFGLSPRPDRSLVRGQLTILERRRPDRPDTGLLSADWVLVRCLYEKTTLELGMSEMAYNGLATWLESAPPGEHPHIAS